MPLLRTETIHGFSCKFYDNAVVMVGTTSGRFSLHVPAEQMSWFSTRLRAELIKRELATADNLVVDEAGEAAMAKFNAAKVRAAASKAASIVAREAEIKRERVAAALDTAKQNEANAGLKRQLAEGRLKVADLQAKVAKAAVPLMSEKPTAKTAPLRGTLDAFLRPK
jgi:hypothetical protein